MPFRVSLCSPFFAIVGLSAATAIFPGKALANQEPPVAVPPVKQKKVNPGVVIFNPANNHYYQSFDGSMTWQEAYKEASLHTFQGVKGHLATVTNQEEYDFIVGSLFVYDSWSGGYRDATQLTAVPNHGWKWITGEPWGYTNWNEGAPNDKELKAKVLSFWTGSQKWSAHDITHKPWGYVVEYPTGKPADAKPLAPPQEIDRFITAVNKRYEKMTTYSATVEFTFKAFKDTIQNVRAELLMQSNGQFRLEGRGENGKLIAISDGKRLMLGLTAPGERMKFVVKPMPTLSAALKEAFSLLTSSPKPPSIVSLITGAFDTKIYSANGLVGEYVGGKTDDEIQEQAFRAKVTVRLPGEDPMDGDIYLRVGLEQLVFTRSDLDFRFKAYPYTVRETHSNIKINEPIPGHNFVLVITTNARQVDDLGEGDDLDVTFAARKAEKK
ncbi:MAG: hypothetical protein V4671_18250 [Armatimonadota bacterium]